MICICISWKDTEIDVALALTTGNVGMSVFNKRLYQISLVLRFALRRFDFQQIGISLKTSYFPGTLTAGLVG